MSPERRSCWLPLTRLTAFFVAVVVSGTLFLRAIHTPASGAPESPEKRRSLEKHRKKLRKKWDSVRLFFGSPVPPKDTKPKKETARPAALFDPVLAVEPGGALFDVRCPDCGEASLGIEAPKTLGDSLSLVEFHRQAFYADLPLSFRPMQAGWLEQAANAAFSVPESVIDLVVDALGLFFPSPPPTVAELEEQSMLERLFWGMDYTEGDGQTFTHFLGFWYDQEVRFLRQFDRSPLFTWDVEDGAEDIDFDEFLEEQRKVLWDAARKTYFGRFRRFEEQAREEAFHVDRWRGADFVLGPLVVGGMLWWRGFDRKFSIGPTRLRIELEPIQRLVGRWGDEERDLRVALGLEWGIRDAPVKLLVAVGIDAGDIELDFVGIGTGLNEVKRLLKYLSRE